MSEMCIGLLLLLVLSSFGSMTRASTSVAATAPGGSVGSVVATVPVGSYPYAAAYDSGKGEVFVVNSNDGDVSVISDASNSVVANIPVGSYPIGVAYDSGKGEVFVVNSNSNSVNIISDASNSVVANISVGEYPSAAAYDSGKGEVFVVNTFANTVSVISSAAGSGIPEFPVQPGLVLLATALIVSSYLLARRARSTPRVQRNIGGFRPAQPTANN